MLLYYSMYIGPPSAPCDLNTSDVTNTTVFLQWDNPLDDGNRSDLFYTISENISNSSYTTNTTSFALENLIPFVYYEIQVIAENGVSSQDPSVENRSVTLSVMTLEGGMYIARPSPNYAISICCQIKHHFLLYSMAAMDSNIKLNSLTLATYVFPHSRPNFTQPVTYMKH